MKKLINGKIVSIESDVIELFEKAMEGNITKKMIANKIDLALEQNTGHMGEIIAEYYYTYMKLPYPLYNIEEEIKYATIALQMQRKLLKKFKYTPKMRIERSKLYVYSEEGYCIEIASDSWAITDDTYSEEYGTGYISLDDYKEENIYRFFKWCNEKMINDHELKGFYAYAVPGILDACNSKAIIVKWEIAKLLQFADIPDRVEVSNKHIKDEDRGIEYYVDVYWEGNTICDSSKEVMVIDLREAGGVVRTEKKSRKVFHYDVYAISPEAGRVKLKASKTKFDSISSAVMREFEDNIEKAQFYGIISEKYVAVRIGNKLLVGEMGHEMYEIGVDVKLINIKGSRVYIQKSIKKEAGAVRDAVYVYDIQTDKLKACDVQYSKGVTE